jgi:aspartyl-tRNA(Asn)/glutamyl-tRNA(Gln) amidotransferase subunit A
LFVTKETWRTDLLPGTIRSNWDNPSQLYNVIVAALNDGFRADILKATLPIGLQIVAPWLAEETILSIAAAFEQARPWSGQWPALAA